MKKLCTFPYFFLLLVDYTFNSVMGGSSPISASSIRALTGLWMGWRPCGLGAISTAISHPADPLICCRDERGAARAPEAPDEVLTRLSTTYGIKKKISKYSSCSKWRRSLKFYCRVRNVAWWSGSEDETSFKGQSARFMSQKPAEAQETKHCWADPIQAPQQRRSLQQTCRERAHSLLFTIIWFPLCVWSCCVILSSDDVIHTLLVPLWTGAEASGVLAQGHASLWNLLHVPQQQVHSIQFSWIS